MFSTPTFQEGFIDATVVAMDATHIEARDRQPEKQSTVNTDELPTELPKKKRGRKSKAERNPNMADWNNIFSYLV